MTVPFVPHFHGLIYVDNAKNIERQAPAHSAQMKCPLIHGVTTICGCQDYLILGRDTETLEFFTPNVSSLIAVDSR